MAERTVVRVAVVAQRQHVAAEAVLVGGLVAGLVDAAINATTQMLDECAEQAGIGTPDREIAIE